MGETPAFLVLVFSFGRGSSPESEVQSEVDAYLQRVATLCEYEVLSCCRALDGDGVEVCGCEVSSPEGEGDVLREQVGMRTECGVEFLADGVGVVPVCLSHSADVGTQAQADGRCEGLCVVERCCEGVFRHEWHAVVFVADGHGLAVDGGAVGVFLEGGVGVGVGCHPLEAVVECCSAECYFCSAAVASAGIDHHATESVVSCHDGELLVAHLHIEC